MSLSQDDIKKANQWFAIECNNAAWDLTSQADLSAEQRQELLLTAYASVYHWSKVGEPVNVARGEMLLAHTHAIRGEGEAAMRYAKNVKAFYDANGGDTWEIAFGHLEIGFAYGVLGDKSGSASQLDKVRELIGQMDREDAAIVEDELKRVEAILS